MKTFSKILFIIGSILIFSTILLSTTSIYGLTGILVIGISLMMIGGMLLDYYNNK